MSDNEAIELWTKKVWDRVEEVDPASERDWEDLAFGFLLALDFEPEKAYKLTERMIRLGVI